MKHDMIHSDVVLVSTPCIYCKTNLLNKEQEHERIAFTSDLFARSVFFFFEAMPLLWREFQSKLGVSETSTWSAQLLGAIPKNPKNPGGL